MTYDGFRDQIKKILTDNPAGLTWSQIKEKLNLPQRVPNNKYVTQMEKDIGLIREQVQLSKDSKEKTLIWRLPT